MLCLTFKHRRPRTSSRRVFVKARNSRCLIPRQTRSEVRGLSVPSLDWRGSRGLGRLAKYAISALVLLCLNVIRGFLNLLSILGDFLSLLNDLCGLLTLVLMCFGLLNLLDGLLARSSRLLRCRLTLLYAS